MRAKNCASGLSISADSPRMIASSAFAESSEIPPENGLSIGVERATAAGAKGRREFPAGLCDDVIIDSTMIVGGEVLTLFLDGIPGAE